MSLETLFTASLWKPSGRINYSRGALRMILLLAYMCWKYRSGHTAVSARRVFRQSATPISQINNRLVMPHPSNLNCLAKWTAHVVKRNADRKCFLADSPGGVSIKHHMNLFTGAESQIKQDFCCLCVAPAWKASWTWQYSLDFCNMLATAGKHTHTHNINTTNIVAV